MRPRFHLTAETGWVNDPHAITFHDGEYHVFYQYVPDSTVWAANCHWGHAIGSDVINRTLLPVAIEPGEGDDGVWTGSLVTDRDGESTVFYTSVRLPDIGIGRVRTAQPTDDSWLSWKKGPVVIEAPAEFEVVAYRDPFVFMDGDDWRMFVGAGLADGTATAMSYRSADLKSWQFEGIAVERSTSEREPVWMGSLWECPQLFELDGRHVLVSSVWDDDVLYYAGYGIGSYTNGKFVAESWGQLTFGPSYYAPSFFRDADDRPCLILWMRGIEDQTAGWAGAHSVAHLLRIEDGRLVASPHPDLETYHGDDVDAETEIAGLALDVVWNPGGVKAGLSFFSGNHIALSIDLTGDALTVSAAGGSWSMPSTGGPVRIILDGPTAEISSSTGILGCAIAPAGSGYLVHLRGGDADIWTLHEH